MGKCFPLPVNGLDKQLALCIPAAVGKGCG